MFERGGGDFGRPARICFGQYAADEQALSAHGLEYAGFFADFLQGGGEFRALADGVGAGGFAVDDVEGGAADGAGQGVAAEGRTVRAGAERRGDAVGGKHRADGEAAAQGFRAGQDVGCDAAVLVGEEFAGAPHAGLDFVEYQGGIETVAQFARGLQELGSRRQYAAFALHGFDDDGAGLRGYGLAQCGGVVEGDMDNAFGQRGEVAAVFGLAADGNGKQGAAVEGVGAGDDLVFAFAVAVAGVFARQFQGGFVGFRTRIAKEDFVGKGVLGQAFGQCLRGGCGIDVGDVPEFLRLFR